MRKLFDFTECYKDAPVEPGAGSTEQDWANFNQEFHDWYYSCIAGQIPIPPFPPNVPPPQPDVFEDARGNIWIRTVSSKGVEFKLDFFDLLNKSKSFSFGKTDTFLIIAIKITLGDGYSILTYSQKGIKMQKVKPKKIRLINLLAAISNNSKFPDVDINKISAEPWGKLDGTLKQNGQGRYPARTN